MARKTCHFCQRANEEHARFCGSCGSELSPWLAAFQRQAEQFEADIERIMRAKPGDIVPVRNVRAISEQDFRAIFDSL